MAWSPPESTIKGHGLPSFDSRPMQLKSGDKATTRVVRYEAKSRHHTSAARHLSDDATYNLQACQGHSMASTQQSPNVLELLVTAAADDDWRERNQLRVNFFFSARQTA